MRKVIVSAYVTLDAVMEAPQTWSGQFWNDQHEPYTHDLLFASDALLLGRVTYQGFADAWPFRTGEFADMINSMPKFVASTTLEAPLEWNNSRLLKRDVAEEVAKLKQQPRQNMLIYGCRELVHTLAQHDLADEYRLWIHPVVVGSGKRLFKAGIDTSVLKLIETKTFSSGVVILSYQPAQRA